VSQIIDLMDELKAAEGMTSDYQLSKETGIAQSRISDYRKGRLTPDEYACTRLALALGREPIEVIAMVQAEQAKTEEKREFWRNFLTRAACKFSHACRVHRRLSGAAELWASMRKRTRRPSSTNE